METDIGSESRFLITVPASDTPLGRSPSEYRHDIRHGKTTVEWCGYQMWKSFSDKFICFDRIHKHDRRMDGHTDTTWRHRPCLHCIVRQLVQLSVCQRC